MKPRCGTTRRPGSTRSRTGCRTCRARRIKCDETPQYCRNYTSTGRICDGYDSYWEISVSNRKKKPRNRQRYPLVVANPIADIVSWTPTSDERRCFTFVQARTIPDALSLFDSTLWQQSLMQMQVEAGSVIGRTPIFWYCMAVAQSARSFACLRRRNPHDSQVRDVMLLCCLLFTVVAIIWQEYAAALQHLRAGLCILRETEPSSQRLTAGRWIAAFRHLDTQCAMDGSFLWFWDEDEADTIIHPVVDPWWKQQRSDCQLLVPNDDPLYSVRQTLEPLFNRPHKFVRRCWHVSTTDMQSALTVLSAERLAIAAQLQPAKQLLQELRRRNDLITKS
ncbi:Zn(II)2Cys6 transcription factor domain-containing protein [Aspergillus saccharolyticus JOP 1030-1]|uniref:Zn(2)-C6 fungal-type domain-containing protein n=1 Tax=Aspergillus saccharolyticus JOP 1030-1 TaxID=1450539 RepID=A0A318ZEM7_9EURO|nr:hypothetical protein BP01DRAFT_383289 [Aspergillus saccharolyticus JOP 1030-1]PYH44724.1 hypothetical protein BP01DRAFT_383289 [Aspergillus saccharolyticus JOP 1030-1]